jgi:hypothetical protein
VRRELDRGIEADGRGVVILLREETLNSAKVRFSNSQARAFLAPDGRRPLGIGQETRAVDQEQRPTVESNITRVRKDAGQPAGVGDVVVVAVVLTDEEVLVSAVPPPRPRLVRPAEAERKLGLACTQYFVERSLEESSTSKPIVVPHEPIDPVS